MAKENTNTESTSSENTDAIKQLSGSQDAPAITNSHITQSKGRSIDPEDQ